MQYRMRGKVYELPATLASTDTNEVGRVQWLARSALYNPGLQQAARELFKKGIRIHTSDRGEYIVCDHSYNVQDLSEYHDDQQQEETSPLQQQEREQPNQEEAVQSPTVAITIQEKRYWVVFGGVSSITAWEQYRREHRAQKSLPTTEEIIIWELRKGGAKKQSDGSWSLPVWMTLEVVERSLHFDIVSIPPIPPAQDPLIQAYEHYRKQFPTISGY